MAHPLQPTAMLESFRSLALEVTTPAVAAFYRDELDLPVLARDDEETVLDAGGTDLVLRRPSTVPRGGLHVHYALATGRYDEWYDRLAGDHDVHEERFGDARSLYLDDPAGNCVEIGERGEGRLDGAFELVLEVEDLDRAAAFYRTLELEVVDVGDRRPRMRLTAGPFDLELWEPQLGIADARGGVHVDAEFGVADPRATAEAVSAIAGRVEVVDGDARVKDPDGHYLTFRQR